MKTRHIALSLLAGAAMILSSCQVDKNITNGEIGENEVAFRIGSVQTRSSAEASPEKTVVASKVMDGGEQLFLEETVENLNEGIVTRGTPAYTENVTTLYGSFYAHEANSLGDATFTFDGDTYWTHGYGKDVWKEAPFSFFLRMPVSQEGVSGYKFNTDGSTEFDYTAPSANTGASQQDILFAYTTMQDQSENGKTVTFYHALTGVKFANFYSNSESDTRTVAKTKIKEVSLTGMKNSGHCVMTKDGVATWTNLDGKVTFTQTFDEETFADYSKSQHDLSKLNPTASERNLNDDDASLTFWVVPQEIEAGAVTITVKFDVELVNKDKGTSETTYANQSLTVTLVKQAADSEDPTKVTWTAGQLHTFTLKPVVVGVDIDDEMSDYVKSDIVVKNEGNVYEYVRVNLVGNWVGQLYKSGEGDDIEYESDKTILNGYTTETGDELRQAWNDKDGYTSYGEFVNLVPKSNVIPASSDNTINNWVRYDKYYYYIKPIGPDDSVTDQLFTSYTVGVSPEFWIPDKWGIRHKAGNVHLEMDLMVQAIPAPVDNDGNVTDNDDNQGYIRAWVKALGKTEASDLLDL